MKHIFTVTALSILLMFANPYETAMAADLSTTASFDTTAEPNTTAEADATTEESMTGMETDSENLNVVNGQGTFSTTLAQGQNRFEVFYSSESENTFPSLVFEVGGNTYLAEYGQKTDEDYPITVLKGESISITPQGQEKGITLNMLAIYFDTSKTPEIAGSNVDVTVNLNSSDVFIVARTENPADSQITDGDEKKEPIYTSGEGALLKYYTETPNLLGTDDIVSIVRADNTEQIQPTIAKPKKKDPTKARIALGVFLGLIASVIIATFVVTAKKKTKKLKEEKIARKKAKRKEKENAFRNNDRLLNALDAYADEYSDDDYNDMSEDEKMAVADEAAKEGMRQIPQEQFAAYSPAIKEVLYTVGPQDDNPRGNEVAIRQKEETGTGEDKPRMIIDSKEEEESQSLRQEPKLQPKAESETKSEIPEIKSQQKLQPKTKPQPKPESKPQPQAKSQPKPEVKPKAQPKKAQTVVKKQKAKRAVPGTVKIDVSKLGTLNTTNTIKKNTVKTAKKDTLNAAKKNTGRTAKKSTANVTKKDTANTAKKNTVKKPSKQTGARSKGAAPRNIHTSARKPATDIIL